MSDNQYPIHKIEADGVVLNGGEDSLWDYIMCDEQYKLTKLRCLLLALCKTKTDETVLELLSQQYTPNEVADKTGMHPESVRRIIRRLRKRWQNYKKNEK